MVCIAIFALAMVFTLLAALRQQKLTIWLVRRGRCAPAMHGSTGIQCGSAVATCSTAKSWKKELSRPFYGGPKVMLAFVSPNVAMCAC